MKKFFYSFLFSALISSAFAQDNNTWTLERCIDHALRNNLDIKRQELQTILSEKDYNQSRNELLPGFSGGVEHQISSGRSLNIETYEWENRSKQQGSAGIRGDLTLFKGLQNYHEIQSKKFIYLSKKEDMEAMKNEKVLMLVAYYLDILFSEEILEVAESQLEVTGLQVESQKKKVEVGNAARSELLDIQALAASDKLRVIEASNELNLAILDLTQLLDLDSAGDFKVFKPELEISMLQPPSAVDEIFDQAVSIMPDIKSAQYLLNAQEKEVASAKADRWPEVYLSGLYYSRYLKDAVNPMDPNPSDPSIDYNLQDQLKDNQYSQVTIGLGIPIFSKFRKRTNISKSKVLLEDYNYMLEQEKQKLYKNIQQYHADAVGAWEKYMSAGEAVKYNEEAFEYTSQKFEVGLVSPVEFNISKNNLSKARSDLVQSKYEYIFKLKILEHYQGKPIRL